MSNQPKDPTAADWTTVELDLIFNGDPGPGVLANRVAAALLAAERRGREQATQSEGMSFDEYRKRHGAAHGGNCRKCGADLVCRERGKSDE